MVTDERRFTRYPAHMRDWTPALRSQAARAGWQTRRTGATPWERLLALLKTADPAAVRRYHCDVAEALLPAYLTVVKDDPRPATALWTMRRYASGLAGEAERLAVWRLMIATADAYPGTQHPRDDAGYAALDAIGWTTIKRASAGLRTALMNGSLDRYQDSEHLAALASRALSTAR